MKWSTLFSITVIILVIVIASMLISFKHEISVLKQDVSKYQLDATLAKYDTEQCYTDSVETLSKIKEQYNKDIMFYDDQLVNIKSRMVIINSTYSHIQNKLNTTQVALNKCMVDNSKLKNTLNDKVYTCLIRGDCE